MSKRRLIYNYPQKEKAEFHKKTQDGRKQGLRRLKDEELIFDKRSLMPEVLYREERDPIFDYEHAAIYREVGRMFELQM